MKYFWCLIAFVLPFIACNKQNPPEPISRLAGWAVRGSDTVKVVYNPDNTVKQLQKQAFWTNFFYEGGMLVKKENVSRSANLSYREDYWYKEGKLVRVDYHSFQTFPVVFDHDSLVYNAENKLAEVHKITREGQSDLITKTVHVMEWEGDNIRRITYFNHSPEGVVKQGVSLVMSYNTTPNFLHETIKGGFSKTEFDYEFLNANSIDKVTIYGFGVSNGYPMVHTRTYNYFTTNGRVDSIGILTEIDDGGAGVFPPSTRTIAFYFE
jgi:hypothetical protein